MLSLPLVRLPIINITSAKSITSKSNNNNLSPPSRLILVAAAAAAAERDDSSSVTHWGLDGDANLTEEEQLRVIPKHVGMIMDGNRRWAMKNNLPVQFSHKAGVEILKPLAINCSRLGVKVLTVFLFSTENWARPHEEVHFLMRYFEVSLKSIIPDGMRVSFIGDKTRLPESLRSLLESIEVSTKANQGMHFMMAMNYSGRYDIVQATKEIATKVIDGVVRVEDVNEAIFEQHLVTADVEFPHPDLIIRTSGEMRISNFMLWQSAYSEFYFADKLFPEFGKTDLIEAFKAFERRQRRYGGHKY